MISTCRCKHKGQDELHGEGNRVFNELAGGNKDRREYRCTVCLATKVVNGNGGKR